MSSYLNPIKEDLPIQNIELDTTNPRIRWAFDEQEPNKENIQLALESSTSDDNTATSYRVLKNSIKVNKGIINPIIVNKSNDGKLVAIEGNTRVLIYIKLLEETGDDHWKAIPSYVYSSLKQHDIEAIRLGAHIVGHREWDAYSKAKYLFELYANQKMDFSDISALCGGKQADIEKSVEAYQDMQRYYRPRCEELQKRFDSSRYSSFKELQNTNVKTAITEIGKNISDFSDWVINQKIRINADVRHLKKIFRHNDARNLFLSEGGTAEEAIKLTQEEPPPSAKDMSLLDLMLGLKDKLDRITLAEINQIKNSPEGPMAEGLIDVHEKVENVWEICQLETE
jgi:hypothetical protein